MKAKLIKLALHDGYRLDDENGLLIASTHYSSKNKLSLENCQKIERGYDLDELVDEEISEFDLEARIVYRRQLRESLANMFQKALQLMGDKAFNEKDGKFIFECGRNYQVTGDIDCHFKNAIQSLQQTEWDVDVKMRRKDIDELRESGEGFLNNKNLHVPELDADGCLILTRISE